MKKRKVNDKEAPKKDANAIANMFGGFLGKAVEAFRGRKSKIDEPAQGVDPDYLEQEKEQNFSKVMKKYSKRAK